jgi:hypothetical protein
MSHHVIEWDCKNPGAASGFRRKWKRKKAPPARLHSWRNIQKLESRCLAVVVIQKSTESVALSHDCHPCARHFKRH